MLDDMVVSRGGLHEAGLGLNRLDCGLEMVIACISKYSRGTPARLPRLSDHIARRELAGEGLPAAIKQIVARVPVKRFLCALPMQGCR